MLRRSVIGARYTMRATILRASTANSEPVDLTSDGSWVEKQDPITGEIVTVWEPAPETPTSDNPNDSPDLNSDVRVDEIWCWARGIVDGGVRAAATTEDFDDIYRNVDIINMWVPRNYRISKRDRVTNIRTPDGHILWRDEEHEDSTDPLRATVFNVNGVIPVLDPFNRHIDNFCLLERAEV